MAVPNRKVETQRNGSGIAQPPSPIIWLSLGLRAVMETGVVVGLAYWGYETGANTIAKIGLALGVPLLGIGFWGAVDFHQAGRAAEALRLVQELVVTGLVALALGSAGQPLLGLMLALLSVVYHALVYVSGGRLLKARPKGR